MAGACGSFIPGDGAYGVIESQLALVQAKGNEAYNTAMSAINTLANLTRDGVSESGVYQPGTFFTSIRDTSQEFNKPNTPDSVSNSFSMPADPRDVTGDLDDIARILDDILTDLRALIANVPTFSGVSIDDNFLTLLINEYNLLTSMLDDILTAMPFVAKISSTLDTWLDEDAIGMPTDVEQALRDRAFVTEDRKLSQAESEALNDWLARGFSIPAGALDAKLVEVRQQNNDAKGGLNRDVYIQAAEWERDTRKFALEKAMAYDGTLRESFFKTVDLARSIASEWQQNKIKIELAKVDIYKAEIEAFAATARALGDVGNTTATLIKAKIDEQNGYIELFKAKLQGQLGKLDAAVKVFDADINLYKTEGDMENYRLNTIFKQEDLKLEEEKLETSIELSKDQMELNRLLETTKITVGAFDGIARTASQLAAGWCSALNMSAQVSNQTQIGSSNDCQVTYTYSS